MSICTKANTDISSRVLVYMFLRLKKFVLWDAVMVGIQMAYVYYAIRGNSRCMIFYTNLEEFVSVQILAA